MFLLLYSIIIIISTIKLISLNIYKKKNKLKNQDTLYWHQIKSFTDTFKNNINACLFSITILVVLSVLNYIKKQINIPELGLQTTNEWYLDIISTVIYIISVIPISIFLYSLSEIKHLSPNDYIGKNIKKLKREDTSKKAKIHYLLTSLCGLLGVLILIIYIIRFNIWLTILTLILSTIVFLLGIGDVLQHKNYNSENYKVEIKIMKFSSKLFLDDIFKIFKDIEKYQYVKTQIAINLRDIRLGFIELFILNLNK